jgi:signal transduction histidine kinase
MFKQFHLKQYKKMHKMVQLVKQYIDGAIHASSNELNLVNDLLDMAKIEADVFSLSFKEFNLIETVTQVFRLLEYHAEAKKINLLLNFD